MRLEGHAFPSTNTGESMMWMRLVPLLPILHRLDAVQHFSRAYGGAPPFAERPDTITYAELTTSDWTTDPPHAHSYLLARHARASPA